MVPVLTHVASIYVVHSLVLIELWNEVTFMDYITVQIYNTTNGHVKLLMIRACEESVTAWAAGEFIDYQTILVWDKGSGRGYVYRLSARCVPGLSESDDSLDGNYQHILYIKLDCAYVRMQYFGCS
jgi:hypothetical protein